MLKVIVFWMCIGALLGFYFFFFCLVFKNIAKISFF